MMDNPVFNNESSWVANRVLTIPRNIQNNLAAPPEPPPEPQPEEPLSQRVRGERRLLIGTPEMVQRWFTLIDAPVVYEVIAQLISVHSGHVRGQRLFALRGYYGPALKVIHYNCDRLALPNPRAGTWITCTGTRFNDDTLRAYHIRQSTPGEVNNLPRLTYICNQSINTMLAKVPSATQTRASM